MSELVATSHRTCSASVIVGGKCVHVYIICTLATATICGVAFITLLSTVH